MKKDEFIDRVAQKSGVTKKDASLVVSSFIEEITDLLAAGDKITFSGFGTFFTTERSQTKRTPPGGSVPVVVQAKVIPRFKPGKNLKEKVISKSK